MKFEVLNKKNPKSMVVEVIGENGAWRYTSDTSEGPLVATSAEEALAEAKQVWLNCKSYRGEQVFEVRDL